jgi:hypothetical protein
MHGRVEDEFVADEDRSRLGGEVDADEEVVSPTQPVVLEGRACCSERLQPSP